ncbi:DUF7916 family protein [Lapidilactobacillus wuchangensis]|uniref:DUF7916 family protein n=1 Tax=Lapidilactobacillus wuchangensis TaxID=2486001 RepID=UPI000F7A69C7|nr:haloacid dehalogenase-like hydrolase [Lapidilactobacillus wuchangensis]
MVKRLLSANSSEILAMSATELKAAIQANEGRTILSENVVVHEPLAETITNAEVASAFGADLILLNHFDVQHPFVLGLNDGENSLANVHDDPETIHKLKHLIGRPVGINLEPIDEQAPMLSDKLAIDSGRQANAATVKKAAELGVDFICLTGNPGTGVDNAAIIATLREVRANFTGLIIAGKMHSAGVNEPIIDQQVLAALITAGADIILVPAVGTVPGFTAITLTAIVEQAHASGALVMSTIGTSQESASTSVIEQIALQNKICGVDIQHIGDAGAAGMAPVENILAMSKTIRGQRHTLKQMARSINR